MNPRTAYLATTAGLDGSRSRMLCLSVLLCLGLTGCATTQGPVLLRWNPDAAEKITYNTLIDAEPAPQYHIKQHGFEVARSEPLRAEAKKRLLSIPLPLAPLETTFIKQPLGLRVTTLVTETPQTVDEEASLKVTKLLPPKTSWIQADIDTKGESSFYYYDRAKALLTLFFKLPTAPVNVGDTWQVPLHILQIGEFFTPHSASRINQVRLEGISTSEKGERIAHLFYSIAEKVEGEYVHIGQKKRTVVPINSIGSYIGYGEFYIDKGYWKQLIFQKSVDRGKPPLSSEKKVFALELIK